MAMRYFLAGYRWKAKQDGFAGGTVLWWNPFRHRKGEDLTPGAYLPFGCQSLGHHGAHAAAH